MAMDVEGKEKEEEIKDLNDLDFDIVIKKEEILDEEEQEKLGNKRKRDKKQKRVPIRIGVKKERRVRDPSDFQKILDKLDKYPIITSERVTEIAHGMNYKIDDKNVKFLVDIGSAKVAVKKLGLLSGICRVPFHCFVESEFYKKDITTITDDALINNCYFAYAFSEQGNLFQYAPYAKFAKLNKFSFVTNKVMKFDNVYTGYVQDGNKDIAIISNVPFDPKELEIVGEALNNKEGDSMVLDIKLLNHENTITFCRYQAALMAGEAEFAQLFDAGCKMRTFNSKNKLSAGYKLVKMGDKNMAYIDIVDQKITEFTPSFLIVVPGVTNFSFFLEGELDLNQVHNYMYKNIQDGIEHITQFNLPPNAVFWDNVGSYIEMIGLIDFEFKPDFSNEIANLVTLYQDYKDVITYWKKTYKMFENIVLHFYDAITTKLTIDSIVSLDKKVSNFIVNFDYLVKSDTYSKIKEFVEQLPNVPLMRNFVSTNIPMEMMTALKRLIVILNAGKKLEEMTNITDMFRTIAVYCTRVFLNGQYKMIPKIRSPAAFLGSAVGGMNNETLKQNIGYLLESYKKLEGAVVKKSQLPYEEMDNLIDRVFNNTLLKIDDKFIKDNYTRIKQKIRSDIPAYNSLRDDIDDLLRNGTTIEEIKADYNFLDNPVFSNYLVMYKKVDDAIQKKAGGWDYKYDMAEALRFDPDLVKKYTKKYKSIGKRRFTNAKKKKKVKAENLKKANIVDVDQSALAEGAKNMEKVGEIAAEINNENKNIDEDDFWK